MSGLVELTDRRRLTEFVEWLWARLGIRAGEGGEIAVPVTPYRAV